MAVLGDSTAVELWCSLSCAFLQGGAEMGNSTSASPLSLALQGVETVRMWQGGVTLTWMLPWCGSGRSHCWENGGHSTRSKRACGGDFFEALRKTHVAGSVRVAGRLVVLFNPCTAHYNMPLLESAVPAWQRMRWRDLEHTPSCLDDLSACAGCPTCVASNATATMEAGLEAIVREAAQSLRVLSIVGHLGILVGSLPSHFPEALGPWLTTADGVARGYIGGALGYERFVLSPILWLHDRLMPHRTAVEAHSAQRPGAQESAHMGGHEPKSAQTPSRAAAAATSRALRGVIDPSAHIIPWQGKRLGKNFGWLLHGYMSIEAKCGATPSPDACWQQALREKPGFQQQFASWRPKQCAPSAAPDAYKARIERRVAAQEGVPLLDRFTPRAERWDAHPAASGGDEPTNASLDCIHSNFEPGVWDGELHALQRLLQRHGSGELPVPVGGPSTLSGLLLSRLADIESTTTAWFHRAHSRSG